VRPDAAGRRQLRRRGVRRPVPGEAERQLGQESGDRIGVLPDWQRQRLPNDLETNDLDPNDLERVMLPRDPAQDRDFRARRCSPLAS